MHLTYNDVNDAFLGLVKGIDSGEIPTTRTSSCNGDVLVIEEPVMVTYEKPLQRVLFNQARDCNPFFHLYESLWMLAGRNDAESLAYYNSQMKEFSGDGETFNGAYGWRWRNWKIPNEKDEWESVDQLERIISHLKEKPDSRRSVLEMWSVHSDLNRIETSLDLCCNTHIYFSIRDASKGLVWGPNCGEDKVQGEPISPTYLDMTVCNRSNDMILGMLGANVVHFSFLQEYIATSLGIEVGIYNQMTNNLHVYVDKWKPAKWLEGYDLKTRTQHDDPIITYDWIFKNHGSDFVSLNGETLDKELKSFVFEHSKNQPTASHWVNKFLMKVAQPMCNAFHYHKRREYTKSLKTVELIAAYDWRIAARNWITKRKINWEKKNVSK